MLVDPYQTPKSFFIETESISKSPQSNKLKRVQELLGKDPNPTAVYSSGEGLPVKVSLTEFLNCYAINIYQSSSKTNHSSYMLVMISEEGDLLSITSKNKSGVPAKEIQVKNARSLHKAEKIFRIAMEMLESRMPSKDRGVKLTKATLPRRRELVA